MDRELCKIAGITFMRYAAPCSNFCKFCSAGVKKFDNVTFDTFARIVRRFVGWSAERDENPPTSAAMQYTHAYLSYERSKEFLDLCPPGRYEPLPLQMNGCRFMPDDELADLFDRHRRAGYPKYNITICGDRRLHDRWVGRAGEFESFARMARVAAPLGYLRIENMFLSRSSIPVLDSVMETLDTFPGPSKRQIVPFMYIGNARNLEDERVTAEDLLAISPAARPFIEWDPERPDFTALRGFDSETTWVDRYANGYRRRDVQERYLMVRVTEENAEELLTRDCGEVFEEYAERYLGVFEQIPEFDELCRRYGDPGNPRLYRGFELERKWVEHFVKENLWDRRADYEISSF